MTLQRSRFIVGDAGYEPGTLASQVWCPANGPLPTTSPNSEHQLHLEKFVLTMLHVNCWSLQFCNSPPTDLKQLDLGQVSSTDHEQQDFDSVTISAEWSQKSGGVYCYRILFCKEQAKKTKNGDQKLLEINLIKTKRFKLLTT